MIERIQIENEAHWLTLRSGVLGSTEVSALFGCNKYLTEYELFHLKNQTLPDTFEETARTSWGRRLEAPIAYGIAEDLGLTISPMKEYYIDREQRLGCSFDFAIGDAGILEIKNVDAMIFKNEWQDDEAPLHIELQCQHQLLMSGREFVMIGALVGGNSVHTIRRERDDSAIKAIVARSEKFWKLVNEGVAPAPDWTRDAASVARLFSFASPGKTMEPNGSIAALAEQYGLAMAAEKSAVALKKELKARLLMEIGDAEKVRGDTYSISAGLVGPVKVPEHERAGYRNFKVSFRGEK